jgi:hypothetical protein
MDRVVGDYEHDHANISSSGSVEELRRASSKNLQKTTLEQAL